VLQASGSYNAGTVALRHNVPVNASLVHSIIAMTSPILGVLHMHKSLAFGLEYDVVHGGRFPAAGPGQVSIHSKHTVTERAHIATFQRFIRIANIGDDWLPIASAVPPVHERFAPPPPNTVRFFAATAGCYCWLLLLLLLVI
jgi:hypothetical protein